MARKTRRRVKRVKGTRRIRRIRRIKTYYKGGNRRQNTKGGFNIGDMVTQTTTAVKEKVEEAKEKAAAALSGAKEEVEKNFSGVTNEAK